MKAGLAQTGGAGEGGFATVGTAPTREVATGGTSYWLSFNSIAECGAVWRAPLFPEKLLYVDPEKLSRAECLFVFFSTARASVI